MEEIIKTIKRLGVPMIAIVIVAIIISSYKNYLQIRFYNLSIKKLLQDIRTNENNQQISV